MNAEPASLFQELTGHPINRWQQRLLDQLLAGNLPDALDLPTGLGKTAIIPLWLVARALGAPVPRRLVYIVDRRAVVDQATELADRLTRRLDDDDLAHVRETLGLSPDGSLPVSTLRGQHADNRLWLQDPTCSAIIVGTVDMIGSRLLFKGYGVSRWQRPMHAAMLGCDTLVVLDESHLVNPFDHLLGDLAGLIAREQVVDAAPAMRVMRLSATGADGNDTFRLVDGDADDAWTGPRLKAPKRLQLHEADAKDLIARMVERAIELAGSDGCVVVFTQGYGSVSKIVEGLSKWWRGDGSRKKEPAPIARLTGQTRVAERSSLTEDPVFRRFYDGAEGNGPAFLVANAAGEVGVDFDADHMVCDLVTWERMVQRLGRVNRAGRTAAALIDVYCADIEAESHEAHTRIALESDAWSRDDDGRVDVSPLSLRQTPTSDGALADCIESATTSAPWRPPFTTATLDAWSMTSLETHGGCPDVTAWLRGWPTEHDQPEATIVWRRWLPSEEKIASYLDVARPHLLEQLTTRSQAIREWLVARVKELEKLRERDIKAVSPYGEDAQLDWRRSIGRVENSPCVGLSIGIDGSAVPLRWSDLKQDADRPAAQRRLPAPGSTLIVDSRLGGLDGHGILAATVNDPARAWDEQSPATDADKPEDAEADADTDIDAAVKPSRSRLSLFAGVPRRFCVGTLPDLTAPREARSDYVRLDYLDGDPLDLEATPPRGRWVERLRNAYADERSGDAEALADHQARVVAQVDRFATALKLSDSYRNVLRLSAAHHDDGKGVNLWQSAMGVDESDRPLAKTGHNRMAASLNGYRHEFGSFMAVMHVDEFQRLEEGEQDLVLHLIASHHGRARPWIRAYDPDKRPPVDRLASGDDGHLAADIAVRFDRLQRHYGHHGLAWLECVLRAADWSASAGRDRGERA